MAKRAVIVITLCVLLAAPPAFGAPAFVRHEYPAGGPAARPWAVTSGDFDNNGIPDLAITSSDVLIMSGTPTGGFADGARVAPGSGAVSLASGDFNADGNDDLAVGDMTAGNVQVLMSDGDGGFVLSRVLGSAVEPRAVLAGDFNADGFDDIAYLDDAGRSVRVHLARLGSFVTQPAASLSVPGNFPTLTAGDFDRDGRLDLVTSATSANVLLWRGDGDGTFRPSTPVALGTSIFSLGTGDVDGDGDADLVGLGGGGVAVALGDGAGAFAVARATPVAPLMENLVVGDFDNDGRDDVAVGHDSRIVSVLANHGTDGFPAATVVNAGSWAIQLAAADFDGDGDDDLAAPDRANGELVVLQSGTPPAVTATAAGIAPTPIGSASSRQEITIQNTGGNPLHATALKIEGPDADSFTIVHDGCSGTTVHVLSRCFVYVRFVPRTGGAAVASLRVVGDAMNPLIGLGGTGTTPAIVEPAPGRDGRDGAPGSAGPAGPSGPTGPAGAKGATGPAGQVVCRNNLASRITCDALFEPGTWKVAGAASVSVARGGHVYARGKTTLKGTKVSFRLKRVRTLRRGTYTLTITVGGKRVLRQQVRL